MARWCGASGQIDPGIAINSWCSLLLLTLLPWLQTSWLLVFSLYSQLSCYAGTV